MWVLCDLGSVHEELYLSHLWGSRDTPPNPPPTSLHSIPWVGPWSTWRPLDLMTAYKSTFSPQASNLFDGVASHHRANLSEKMQAGVSPAQPNLVLRTLPCTLEHHLPIPSASIKAVSQSQGLSSTPLRRESDSTHCVIWASRDTSSSSRGLTEVPFFRLKEKTSFSSPPHKQANVLSHLILSKLFF